MEYIKFTLSGKFAFFRDCYRNDVEVSYPHIHRPALIGMMGAVLGMRGRESDMQYWSELKSVGTAIIPSALKFKTHRDTLTNTTGLSSKEGNQIIHRCLLVDPSWDIYLKQNHVRDEVWEELKRRLLERDFVYELGLGRKTHFAEVDGVELGKMELIENGEVDNIDSIIYASDVGVIDEIEQRRLKFTAPVSLKEVAGRWEHVSDKLFFSRQFSRLENLGLAESVEIYATEEVDLRFL